MGDLSVNLDYLASLAKLQQQAAGEIEDATDDLGDSIPKLWWDHGAICGESIRAMQAMAEVRKTAGNNMQEISEDLADKLENGATAYGTTAYGTTDEDASDNLDKQMLSS